MSLYCMFGNNNFPLQFFSYRMTSVFMLVAFLSDTFCLNFTADVVISLYLDTLEI